MPYSGTLLALHTLRLAARPDRVCRVAGNVFVGLVVSTAAAAGAGDDGCQRFIPRHLCIGNSNDNRCAEQLVRLLASMQCCGTAERACCFSRRSGSPRANGQVQWLVLLPLVALTALVVLLRSLRSNRERIVPAVIGIGVMTLLASIPAIVLLAYQGFLSRILAAIVPFQQPSRSVAGHRRQRVGGWVCAVQYAFATLWGQFGWGHDHAAGVDRRGAGAGLFAGRRGVILFLLTGNSPGACGGIVVVASLSGLATLVQSFAKSIGSRETTGALHLSGDPGDLGDLLLVLGLHWCRAT